MFSSMMPQRKEFYELLTAHADRVVASANATLRLTNGLGQRAEDLLRSSPKSQNEHSADKIKAEMITLLHRSFTTPINRDQIHTLTYRAGPGTQRAAGRGQRRRHVQHQGIHAPKRAKWPRSRRCLHAAQPCRDGPGATSSASKEALDLCKEIDAIESKADRCSARPSPACSTARRRVWTALKMREFYDLQEDVLDRCENAAKTIEEILIENA